MVLCPASLRAPSHRTAAPSESSRMQVAPKLIVWPHCSDRFDFGKAFVRKLEDHRPRWDGGFYLRNELLLLFIAAFQTSIVRHIRGARLVEYTETQNQG